MEFSLNFITRRNSLSRRKLYEYGPRFWELGQKAAVGSDNVTLVSHKWQCSKMVMLLKSGQWIQLACRSGALGSVFFIYIHITAYLCGANKMWHHAAFCCSHSLNAIRSVSCKGGGGPNWDNFSCNSNVVFDGSRWQTPVLVEAYCLAWLDGYRMYSHVPHLEHLFKTKRVDWFCSGIRKCESNLDAGKKEMSRGHQERAVLAYC